MDKSLDDETIVIYLKGLMQIDKIKKQIKKLNALKTTVETEILEAQRDIDRKMLAPGVTYVEFCGATFRPREAASDIVFDSKKELIKELIENHDGVAVEETLSITYLRKYLKTEQVAGVQLVPRKNPGVIVTMGATTAQEVEEKIRQLSLVHEVQEVKAG